MHVLTIFDFMYVYKWQLLVFSARCNIYISRYASHCKALLFKIVIVYHIEFLQFEFCRICTSEPNFNDLIVRIKIGAAEFEIKELFHLFYSMQSTERWKTCCRE